MIRIAVVSCVWQRPERLAHTLHQLSGQTDTDFDLLLINNNADLQQHAHAVTAKYEVAQRMWIENNAANRGPYARIEVMHEFHRDYDAFLTLDDDADIDADWIATWRQLFRPTALQGWMGFHFVGGDYWRRETAEPGEACSYLWGSNLCVPAAAVAHSNVLDMPKDYRLFADDLWLCYFAQHEREMHLQRAARAIPIEIQVDGKDTYTRHMREKARFLRELRKRGWQA